MTKEILSPWSFFIGGNIMREEKGKVKRFDFRVDEDFYELYKNICKELGCSQTQYFIESSLSPYYVVVHPAYEMSNEAGKLLTRINHNMNQLARAMNQLVLFMKEKNNVDMMLHEDYAKMAEHFTFMQSEVKKLLELQKEQYSNLFQVVNERVFYDSVREYLEKNDPEYLEILSKRENDV